MLLEVLAVSFSQELRHSHLTVHSHGPSIPGGYAHDHHVCTPESSPLLQRTAQSVKRAQSRTVFVAISLQLTMSVHSLFEGLGLGAERKVSEVASVLIAICVHKGIESFVIASAYVQSTLSRQCIVGLMSLFACMTPLGIIVGLFLPKGDMSIALRGILISLAAGTFLYVSFLVYNCIHPFTIESG